MGIYQQLYRMCRPVLIFSILANAIRSITSGRRKLIVCHMYFCVDVVPVSANVTITYFYKSYQLYL